MRLAGKKMLLVPKVEGSSSQSAQFFAWDDLHYRYGCKTRIAEVTDVICACAEAAAKPHWEDGWEDLAMSCDGMCEYSVGLQCAIRANHLAPRDNMPAFYVGYFLHKNGLFIQARDFCLAHLRRAPNCPDVMACLAILCVRDFKRIDEGQNWLDQAMACELPDDSVVEVIHRYLTEEIAEAREETRDYAYLDRARWKKGPIKPFPDLFGPSHQVKLVWERAYSQSVKQGDRLDKKLMVLAGLTASDPVDGTAWWRLANVILELGQPCAALQCALRAACLGETSVETRRFLLELTNVSRELGASRFASIATARISKLP